MARIKHFRWLEWDSGSFVVRHLRRARRIPLAEIADIREFTYNDLSIFSVRGIEFLLRGQEKYIAVTGGSWTSLSLARLLSLPGLKAEFERRLTAAEEFRIGSRRLHLQGEILLVKDGSLHGEISAPISSMRLSQPTFGEQFLQYDALNAMSLGTNGNRSLWQALLLELPFPR